MVVGTVHHVSRVDKLVSGAFHAQLNLGIAQHDLPPANRQQMVESGPVELNSVSSKADSNMTEDGVLRL